jgi:hypothetical protein
MLSKNIRIYKTAFLVLCGFGTLSLTLKEEHLLRVFEIRDEVTVVEKYFSPNIIRMMKSDGQSI